MTATEAYHLFLLKVNRNDTQQRIAVGVPRFVALFREQALLWMEQALLKGRISNNLVDLQYLLKPVSLLPESIDIDKTYFALPEDYYQVDDSRVRASKGVCERFLYLYNLLSFTNLQDSFAKPSFDWEETLFVLQDNKLAVFHDDFQVKELELTYYKDPGRIDIGGYINTTNQPSYQVDPILTDTHTIEVLNMCALEHIRSTSQTEDYQIAATRNQ